MRWTKNNVFGCIIVCLTVSLETWGQNPLLYACIVNTDSSDRQAPGFFRLHGAIAVLFLFVVMMLNIKISEVIDEIYQYLPVGGLIGIIFLLEVFIIVDNDFVPLLN